MNHSEAIKSKATERYLLGELALSEREAFEEHYFECQECAADVKSAAIFVDNAREVLRHEPVLTRAPERKPAWWEWFTRFRPAYALASLLFVVILGYQNLVTIPQLRHEAAANTPQALPSFSLLTSGSRSESAAAFTVQRNSPFGLYVDIPSSPFDHYLCEVQAENGNPKFSVRITAEQARDTVQLFIPGAVLAAGRYNLVILGSPSQQSQKLAGEEIARYPFVIQTK